MILPNRIERLSLDELTKRAAAGILRGVFYVDNDDYHMGPGISSTDCKALLKSPGHYHAQMRNRKRTEALDTGTACHIAILEPEKFRHQCVIEPKDLVGKSKTKKKENGGCKEDWEAFKKAAEGRIILRRGTEVFDGDDIDAIMQKFEDHGLWNSIRANSVFELAAYARDPITKVLCKAKVDVFHRDTGDIFDLKTTRLDLVGEVVTVETPDGDVQAETLNSWKWEVFKRQYDLSMAFYKHVFNLALDMKDGSEAVGSCHWIPVEKSDPYGIRFVSCPPEMMEGGRRMFRKALSVYRGAVTSGNWGDYPEDFSDIMVSDFEQRRYEHYDD